MQTTWLPSETLQRRRQLQRVLLSRREKPEIYHFSEFLTGRKVLFFDGHESKIEAVEALVGTLSGQDPRSALQAIWAREREGAMIIPPDAAILRGRLAGTHHLRAALGLCSKGITNPSNPHARTRVFVVLVGPVDQTHLHMNLLVSISALLHSRDLVEKLLASSSAEQALQILIKAEGLSSRKNPLRRALQGLQDFFHLRYGWGSK